MSSRLTSCLVVVGLALLASTCSKSDSTSTTPTAPTPATRVIGLSGNLAFGNVAIGQKASATLTITNGGNAPLTVTGMTAPSTGSGIYSGSWTNGTISPGGSQPVTVFAAPTAAITYNGTLTVNGDQTSGTNTIAISATGTTPTPAPAPTPLSFSITGTVTDGFSHNILKNITVQVVAGTNLGRSGITDNDGNYAMSGLSAGTCTLSATTTGYQTTTQQITISGNTRVDLVLPRVAPTTTTIPPTPIPASCNNGPYKFDSNPNVNRCRDRQGQFAPSVCCGR